MSNEMLRRAMLGAVLLLMSLAACSGDETESAESTNSTNSTNSTTTSVPTTTSTTVVPPTPLPEREFEVVLEQPDDLPGYNLHRPADLDAAGEPMPVVVWANGACLRHDRPWIPMFERWAKAGLVVISITRPPDLDPEASAFETGTATAEDQALAIDWAIAQTEDPDGPYAGRFDPDRIVAAGNSCGGITSLALAGEDDRVTAIFVLSGSSVGPTATPEQAAEIMNRVKVPVAFVVGGEEDIARSAALQDHELLGEGIPGLVVMRTSGDHWAVSTGEEIVIEAAEIGLHWLDLVTTGSATAAEALTDQPCGQCEPGLWTSEHKNLTSLVR